MSKPVIVTGQFFNQSAAVLDTEQEYKKGYEIRRITFLNQGTNSIVSIVPMGGAAEIELAPGALKMGANLVIDMPEGCHDTTKYRFKFSNAGLGGSQINNLQVLIIKANKND